MHVDQAPGGGLTGSERPGTGGWVPTGGERDLRGGILARAGQILFVLVLTGVIVFGAAGRLDWAWGWVFLAIYVVSISINAAFLLRTSPDVVAERGRPAEFKRWDALISGGWALFQYLGIPIVAGLDLRLGWTGTVDVAWHVLGAVVFAAGLGLFGWAMIENAYFSTAARIQGDRGQTVCRTGPYRFVRHPGYVGAILQSIGAAVLLGSAWAVLPAVGAGAFMVARTALEDRMLRAELAGYADYAREVRYRLMPGVW
jgi:protein-S-isoprenylcysteine O-methyltransferase Ste14